MDPSFALFATARDPCAYEYAGARNATDEAVSVSTITGGQAVTPEAYMAVVAALQPDAYVALSDEVPADARGDRVAAALGRAAPWLARCLAAPQPPNAAVFAAVQGGGDPRERQRCAQALAAHAPHLAGFVLAGLGTGESPRARALAVAAVLAELPQDKARLASCVGAPGEVADAVAQGVDLFDMAYVADATALGYALNFPLSPAADATAAAGGGAGALDASVDPASGGQDDSKMNLWAGCYRADARPLVEGCSCAACASHSRAYIHHLLHAHEMTAQVLLEAHNTLHYLRYFAALRAAVAAGSLAAYRRWMRERKQRWLAGVQGGHEEANGQGGGAEDARV
jgi:queuine tRNA-ribosyltransferase subunit QTRTD1